MASRLIDKMFAESDEATRTKLAILPVITADNISEYMQTKWLTQVSMKQRRFGEAVAELPSITPPFEKMFIQFRFKKSEIGGVITRTSIDTDEARWQLYCDMFSAKAPTKDMAHFRVGITPEGTPYMGRTDGIAYLGYYAQDVEDLIIKMGQSAIDRADSEIQMLSLIVMWTLAFMNTKNVTMEAVEPSTTENHKRQKHGKLPLMRYHVLKIRPVGREAGHDQGGTHTSPALHIRRGHFKTYTDVAPLFGKLVGTFWVDQHIAGKKSDRLVIKDYEVLTQ